MGYRLKNLTKTYNGKPVLDLEHLDIEPGRIYALVGANGAGKTTLLNLLAFLDRPTTGIIYYATKPVEFSQAFLQSIRKEIIMVHQHPIMFSTTVYKNLELGLKIRKLKKARRKEMIYDALKQVGMQNKINATAKTLSGGEIQRTALARALVLNPKVLLCDEPTAYVDLEHRNIIMDIIQDLNSQHGTTVIFATHDVQQASNLAHNIIMLERGRLIDSTYDNLYTAVITQGPQDHVQCRIQNALEIKIKSDKTGTRRVFIDPEKVQLAGTSPIGPGSTRLQGEVIQISSERDKIRIQARSIIPIALVVSKTQYQQQNPKIGQEIIIDITPESIRID